MQENSRMRSRAARLALAGAGVGLAACGARSGLLLDLSLNSSIIPEVDAAVTPQSGPFICPGDAKLDVCGDNMYRAGAQWPTFQRCSSHPGRTTVVGPTKPYLKWQPAYKGDALLGPPSVDSDGTIYVSGNGGLKAFNPDGSLKWFQQLSVLDTGSSAVAIGPDGTIYIGLDNVYALSPVDGTRIWTSAQLSLSGTAAFETLEAPGSSVTLGPCGMLFIGSPSGLHVTDFADNAIWTVEGQGKTPAVDATGRSYYATSDGRMIAYNQDGTQRWTFSLNAERRRRLPLDPAVARSRSRRDALLHLDGGAPRDRERRERAVERSRGGRGRTLRRSGPSRSGRTAPSTWRPPTSRFARTCRAGSSSGRSP